MNLSLRDGVIFAGSSAGFIHKRHRRISTGVGKVQVGTRVSRRAIYAGGKGEKGAKMKFASFDALQEFFAIPR